MPTLSRLVRAVPLVLLLMLLVTGVVAAADEARFGMRPANPDAAGSGPSSYFVFDAVPGQVIHDEVLITNSGEAAGSVLLYPADAATGQTSGVVYQGQDEARVAVGAWITLEENEVTLGPGESRTVGFTVMIPDDARPGHHVGGIAAQNLATTEGSGQLRVTLQTRLVTAVQLNLPGTPIEHLALTRVSPAIQGGKQTLLLALENDGNQMLKPQGKVTIREEAGGTVAELPVKLHTVLPEARIDYPVVVPDGPLAPGSYHVTVDLTYGEQGTLRYDETITITAAEVPAGQPGSGSVPVATAQESRAAVPIWLIVAGVGGGVLAGLLLAGLIVLFLRRRTRPQPMSSAPPTQPAVPAPGTIKPLVPPGRSRPADPRLDADRPPSGGAR